MNEMIQMREAAIRCLPSFSGGITVKKCTKEPALVRFFNIYSNICEKIGLVLATTSGCIMLFSLLVGVITRLIPNITPAIWSEEIARMCMLWLTSNGASVAYKRLELVKFNLISDALPKKMRYLLEIFSFICIFIVLIILIHFGYDMLLLKMKVHAAATKISYFWWALGLFIGFVLMLVHTLKHLADQFSQWKSVMKGAAD